MQIIKAKFYGPTNTKGARFRVVAIKGIHTWKSQWVSKDYAYSLIYDQFESQGWKILFDDGGWSYFQKESV